MPPIATANLPGRRGTPPGPAARPLTRSVRRLLDLAGPAPVFRTAAGLGYPYDLHYVAERPEVLSAQDLPVRAAREWPQQGSVA